MLGAEILPPYPYSCLRLPPTTCLSFGPSASYSRDGLTVSALKICGFLLKETVSVSLRRSFILSLSSPFFPPLLSRKSLSIAWSTAFSCFIGFQKDFLFPAVRLFPGDLLRSIVITFFAQLPLFPTYRKKNKNKQNYIKNWEVGKGSVFLFT